jgi:hypothetical protein
MTSKQIIYIELNTVTLSNPFSYFTHSTLGLITDIIHNFPKNRNFEPPKFTLDIKGSAYIKI